MPVRSGWLSPDGQSREDTRLVSLGALTPTSPVATRSGILPGSSDGLTRLAGFTMTGTDDTMTATVSPGRAVVQGTDAQGAYPVALTEPMTLTFDDGDPQYTRIDLVVLRVYDTVQDGLGRSEAVVEIVKGEAKAVPVVPATPALALPLYSVSIPAGASAGSGDMVWNSALSGRRTTTVAVGGILPVTSDTAGGSYPGQYRDNNGVLQRWTGSAWAEPAVVVDTATTGATAGTGWSVTSFNARRTRGVCSFNIQLTRTGANLTASAAGTANPGQLTDELICTLPSGWRPATEMFAVAGDGNGSGAVRIATDGAVYLLNWTTSGVIQTNNVVRVSSCYVL
ncbi:hypothetical protein ABZ614_04350 [Streptomyces sp. NPDC013178]|uniref:hypothetical protein n=1 Tax=unclassified Streptomyces TaxID=2593676 RepID=UPI0033C13175